MRKLLLFALATMMFAACADDGLNEPSGIATPETRTLSVSFDSDSTDTRIQLNEEKKSVWTEGDLLSVFYRSATNEQWQFAGKTGDRTGDILPVDSSVVPTPTTNDIVVVYPYNAGYFYNSDTKNVQASLPAEQTYLKDSYGLDGNILVSRSEYNQVSLKSVCGWLKLQLTGDSEVTKSITLKGNNGEQVAGELYINTSDATATLASASSDSDSDEGTGETGGTLVRPGTILTEVTLDCGDGVTLGSKPTTFYIALPPQTFAKGFTVEIEDTAGYVMTQSTDNSLTIERNIIQPMKAFEFVNPNTPTTPTPATNEIWYTATAEVEPYFIDVFGAEYISTTWDSTTGNGVIKFDGEVTMIGEMAFYNCRSLTSVTIPDSVTTIGNSAFEDCRSLTSVTIPDSVTTIENRAFSDCSSLTSVTIGNSVTTIGERAFQDCDSLTSVTIPDSVTSIGEWAFDWCRSLTSVTIPDSVTTIEYGAFSWCDSLTSVTIPDSVTTIGFGAFSGCSSLVEFRGKFSADGGRCLIMDNTIIAYAEASGTEYTIPDIVTTIGDEAFRYCSSLTSVTIPDSVTTIGEWAFYNCYSLTSVTIPDSVTTIGDEAFAYCSSLTSVTIPDSVTAIGGCAFYYCSSLTSVTIPDSVTTIDNYAFSDCRSLKYVYCKATTPPTLGNSYVFGNNASGRKIYVPASDDDSIINAYKKASYWSSYASYIHEYDFSAEE